MLWKEEKVLEASQNNFRKKSYKNHLTITITWHGQYFFSIIWVSRGLFSPQVSN